MVSALPRAEVPVDIGRDEARDAARRELTDPVYHRDDPSLLQQGMTWLLNRLDELLRGAGEISPGGYAGLIVLGVLAVLAVVAIRLTIGPIARNRAEGRALHTGTPRQAAEHRSAADDHAARGEWADAIRERLRAIVRSLEERDLLEVRPGRTADEAAIEAGALLPSCDAGLREAALTFDDVWYGSRRATAAMDEQLRTVDADTAAARPSLPAVAGSRR
ncbi:MAG: DUF4129 domain-containing protein [Pseudonocardiaceae bacterium]|nr:DUF4129 domain-containing protein [Pseudonocardiaceae bacterium]